MRLPSSSLLLAPVLVSACLSASLSGCVVGRVVSEGPDAPAPPTPPARDAEAPRIVIETPEVGAFIEGESLTVSGRVEDGSPVTVTVDGEPVPVAADGAFTVTRAVAPGAHRVRIVATDEAGNQSVRSAAAVVGTFAETGAPIVNAAALTVGRGALDEAGRAGGVILTRTDFDREVTAGNPVASGFWGRADIDGESHGTATVTLTPRDGQLDAEVAIADLAVDATLDPRLGGDVDARLESRRAVFTATASLSVVAGRPSVQLRDVAVRLTGFSFDVSYVPSVLEDLGAVRDAVRGRVEAAVEDAARDALTPLLRDLVSHMPTRSRFDVLGVDVALEATDFEVIVSPDGLWAAADLALTPEDALAERAARGVLVGLADEQPPLHESDLAVDVSVDTLNAAAFAAWQSGLFEAQQTEIARQTAGLTVSQVALLFPVAARAHPSDAPVELELSYPLPPVVSFGPGGATVELVDVRATVFAISGGERAPLGAISIALSAPVEATLSDAGISLRPGELSARADVVGPTGGPEGERLDRLVGALLAPLGDSLVALGPVPVPSLAGFALTPTAITEDGGYLGVEGRARYAPPR